MNKEAEIRKKNIEEQISHLRYKGWNYRQIAAIVRLSPSRVGQIFRRSVVLCDAHVKKYCAVLSEILPYAHVREWKTANPLSHMYWLARYPYNHLMEDLELTKGPSALRQWLDFSEKRERFIEEKIAAEKLKRGG
ncbi:hypothetical protein [Burkholderia cenocepacia]|uniref:hypothetical protein n=1 Tax=Burkholderia cenocepacia TaxID=95486 RepID=UPI002018B7B4|nr:hypothetical protein [Burkholderia cenocepacia]MCO1396410.1 hypothetical protein [Burkholderia cenocepacia]MCO1408984.1 hypothetical protein [Burkholderia cenocepacia]UQN92041.1 hypothetical protein L0Z06_15075 [Burkholderia cenocepacia]UQN99190.1 hypothetical protein L0Z39_16865 [Burkholderia cenocepacia]UQP50855.1 hypothetical protein L0Y99_10380 [Burkholderia cenocepacia]